MNGPRCSGSRAVRRVRMVPAPPTTREPNRNVPSLELLQALPVGVALVIVLEGPWILSLLRGWLEPGRHVTALQLAADKAIVAVQTTTAATIAAVNVTTAAAIKASEDERDRARADAAEWKAAYQAATTRGDVAIEKLGDANEVGKVATHLLETMLGRHDGEAPTP